MKKFLAVIMLSLSLTLPTLSLATTDAAADEAVKAAEALTVTVPESAKDISIKNMNESDIPVHLEAAKKGSSGEGSFYKILAALGILGIMACGAYFFIRKYKHTTGKNAQATQIKILTQHYLGPKKSLAIIRVAGESILVGITDQNINMIKSLSLLDEEIPEELPKNFGNVFARTQKQNPMAEEDEFAISGIKDFVSSKLKNMRSLE